MSAYSIRKIEDLKRQLILSPDAVRSNYTNRLEELLRRMNPDQKYAYRYIYLAITGFQPQEDGAVYPADEVRPDLLRMLLELSAKSATPVSEVDERVLTVGEVTRRQGVSVRTVRRWCRRALISRKYIFPDGRRRTGIRLSAFRSFLDENGERESNSGGFSRISERERREMVALAMRYSRNHRLSLTPAAERISRELGRARETVRYTLKEYQKEHPETTLFPDTPRTLDRRLKREIFEAYDAGQSVASLCDRYDRSRSSIYRIINQVRALRILEEDLDYVFNSEFLEPDAEERILGDEEPLEKREVPVAADSPVPEDVHHYLASLAQTPLLSPEEEANLFRRYNYLKHKVCKLRSQLNPRRYVRSSLLDRIERLRRMATNTKNAILEANLRLVVNVAKKHTGGVVGLFDLVSEGNLCLMQAIENFDYSRGNRFSTYATWALMRRFARTVPQENYRIERSGGADQQMLEQLSMEGPSETERMSFVDRIRQEIESAVQVLTERERTVIRMRYGLESEDESHTLAQIGTRLGVTRERVRQIEAEALRKLRAHMNK